MAVATLACSADSPTSLSDAGTILVQMTIPSSGLRGSTLDIRVLGSGFDQSSEVRFEREDMAEDGIQTNSTQFISSSELLASVTIDEAAELGRYSVVVENGKRGIGLEKFLVLEVIGTLSDRVTGIAHDVNEGGEVVGFGSSLCPGDPCPDAHHAFYWYQGVLEDVDVGIARGVSGDCVIGGCRIVGDREDRPVLWQQEGAIWSRLELPTETGRGIARAISRQGDEIAGSMSLDTGGSTAVVWTEIEGEWIATALPPAIGGQAFGINDLGQVVGTAAGRAIVWTRGDGGWAPHELQPLAGEFVAEAYGINNSGDVVGANGPADSRQRATLWRRTITGWEAPLELVPPEGISSTLASDINDMGIVVGTMRNDELDLGLQQEAFVWAETMGLVGLGRFEGRGTVATRISENNLISGTNGTSALLWRLSLD